MRGGRTVGSAYEGGELSAWTGRSASALRSRTEALSTGRLVISTVSLRGLRDTASRPRPTWDRQLPGPRSAPT